MEAYERKSIEIFFKGYEANAFNTVSRTVEDIRDMCAARNIYAFETSDGRVFDFGEIETALATLGALFPKNKTSVCARIFENNDGDRII